MLFCVWDRLKIKSKEDEHGSFKPNGKMMFGGNDAGSNMELLACMKVAIFIDIYLVKKTRGVVTTASYSVNIASILAASETPEEWLQGSIIEPQGEDDIAEMLTGFDADSFFGVSSAAPLSTEESAAPLTLSPVEQVELAMDLTPGDSTGEDDVDPSDSTSSGLTQPKDGDQFRTPEKLLGPYNSKSIQSKKRKSKGQSVETSDVANKKSGPRGKGRKLSLTA